MKPPTKLQILMEYLQNTVPPKLLQGYLSSYGFQLDPDTRRLIVPTDLDQRSEMEVIEKLELSISTFFGPRFWTAVVQKVEKQLREQQNT